MTQPTGISVGVTSAVSIEPVITDNTGAVVLEGGDVDILTANLETTDADTTTADLHYTVTIPPANGLLLDGSASATSTFTQAEIDNNEISYEHFGEEIPQTALPLR